MGLIVTADDFGVSRSVNEAIALAFERSLITHASLMANMEGFDDACATARRRAWVDRLGVHLVLTEGEPLTETIRSCRRFCDDSGRFTYWRGTDRALHLTRTERRAVREEFRAQVARCRGQGLRIGHLDSHHHVHNKLGVVGIVIDVAREFGVPRIRVAHNFGSRLGFANRAAKRIVNSRLRREGLAGTRLFGPLVDYRELRGAEVAPEQVSIEVNVHPGLRDGRLVDLDRPEVTLKQLLAWSAVSGRISVSGAWATSGA
jgi:predicted glycoside hydrolase/deacetylase ChbG (UPF0249 family)